MSGRPEASQAIAAVLCGWFCGTDPAKCMSRPGHRQLAGAILEAAEQAWPHEPPKRDLTGTTAGQFGLGPIRAPFRRDAQPPRPKPPCGFGTEVTA